MRTTLSIDDDVLAAAKGLAAAHRRTVGEVTETLVRQTLQPSEIGDHHRNGVPFLTRAAVTPNVTLELVNQLRDDLR